MMSVNYRTDVRIYMFESVAQGISISLTSLHEGRELWLTHTCSFCIRGHYSQIFRHTSPESTPDDIIHL